MVLDPVSGLVLASGLATWLDLVPGLVLASGLATWLDLVLELT